MRYLLPTLLIHKWTERTGPGTEKPPEYLETPDIRWSSSIWRRSEETSPGMEGGSNLKMETETICYEWL